MSQLEINISDMQCRVFRMAQKKWNITPERCGELFRKYNIFQFISDCYDTLHLSSYACTLQDVEEILRANGVAV